MEGKSGLYSLLILFDFIRIISFVNSLIEDEAAGRCGGGADQRQPAKDLYFFLFCCLVIYELN